MNKNIKMLFIILAIVIVLVIIITNIFIKKYEKDSLSVKQKEIAPQKNITVQKAKVKVAPPETTVEEEPPISTREPLLY